MCCSWTYCRNVLLHVSEMCQTFSKFNYLTPYYIWYSRNLFFPPLDARKRGKIPEKAKTPEENTLNPKIYAWLMGQNTRRGKKHSFDCNTNLLNVYLVLTTQWCVIYWNWLENTLIRQFDQRSLFIVDLTHVYKQTFIPFIKFMTCP